MSIHIQPGTIVHWGQDQVGTVVALIDLSSLLVRNLLTREKQVIEVEDISTNASANGNPPDLALLPDWQFANLEQEMKVLIPLLDTPKFKVSEAMVLEAAERLCCSKTTIYRKLQKLRNDERSTSLLRKRRQDTGKNRLSADSEKAIQDIIPAYTHIQRLSFRAVYRKLKEKCRELNIKAPHYNTLRKRIQKLEPYEIDAGREGDKFARQKHSRNKGKFPNADFPLAVVQIDHTPVDVILVDDENRMHIGRPYLTLAIDVYSRMVLGFFISLHPVGTLTTAACISMSMLSKSKFLAKLGIEGSWPCWGKPRIIHTDNAKEFSSNALKRACREYGIDLVKRPKTRPNYGPQIESAFRTFMAETHTVPGTTKSNVKEKGEYDSEGHAIFTMDEFEVWFTRFIVNEYNPRLHEGVSAPPLALWKEAILGNDERPGIGFPQKFDDEFKVYLDFLPYIERPVMQYGVRFNNVNYWQDILKPLINAKDPSKPAQKRKFIFRYDAQDMSKLWFFDETTNTYLAIPYSNLTHPPMSLWEIKARYREIRKAGRDKVDEDRIFESQKIRTRMIEEAAEKTAAARRESQKRKQDEKARLKSNPPKQRSLVQPDNNLPLTPFEGIEE